MLCEDWSFMGCTFVVLFVAHVLRVHPGMLVGQTRRSLGPCGLIVELLEDLDGQR